MPKSNKVTSVAIVGGTHGNELTGIHLIKQWQTKQRQNQFLTEKHPAIQIEMLLANQPAIDANKRYLQKDLNRCFKQQELNDLSLKNGEQKIAKQINQALGPKGQARVDFIVDLHTSTANMQTNLVLIKHDCFYLNLAAYLSTVIPDLVITSETSLMDDHHFLCSIANKSVVIEVGPIAQSTVDWNIYHKTEKALEAVLNFVELYNQDNLVELNLPSQIEVMSYFDKVYFPTNEQGEINACIHPNLIHQDYSLIKKGDPIFKTFDGKDLFYKGDNTHIAFINEAAYYDQKIAFCLCNPKKISVPKEK